MPVIQVKVRPNARQSSLEALDDGSFTANLKAPPVDGKANKELIVLVAKRFGVPKSSVAIKSGTAARMKLVSIAER